MTNNGIPQERRQELVSRLWKLGLDCNRIVDDLSRLELIECLIIHAENRDDWRKQAHMARLELDAYKKRGDFNEHAATSGGL